MNQPLPLGDGEDYRCGNCGVMSTVVYEPTFNNAFLSQQFKDKLAETLKPAPVKFCPFCGSGQINEV